ncbi:hypothetical protein, partial [Pseudomonas kitaguniensis]|uniref:hypothetical protein n=1 Tax=Pseudomonas kitaguniensis TaxID=2607908 RepID=UPI0019D5B5BF
LPCMQNQLLICFNHSGRLSGLSKVTRCKSETDISHKPNTGYVPNLNNTPSPFAARQRYIKDAVGPPT